MMTLPLANNINLINTIQMSQPILFSERSLSYSSKGLLAGIIVNENPTNVLSTGHVVEAYRVSANYVIIEEIFVGQSKAFLQAVTVYTSNNQLIGKRFSIKEHEWSNQSSRYIAAKFILDFEKFNIMKQPLALQAEIEDLYQLDTVLSKEKFALSVSLLTAAHSHICKSFN